MRDRAAKTAGVSPAHRIYSKVEDCWVSEDSIPNPIGPCATQGLDYLVSVSNGSGGGEHYRSADGLIDREGQIFSREAFLVQSMVSSHS